MQQSEKHMYRCSDGVLGGVCAGMAECFDIDAAIVRVLVLIASIATAGAFVIVYVAAWLILPAQPVRDTAFDVDPTTFRSDIYEQVVNGVRASDSSVSPSIPPVPPQAASSYYGTIPQVSYATVSTRAASVDTGVSSKQITASLVVGILLIALGAAALLSAYFTHFSPLQFWPLVLVAGGVVRMVIPARDGSRAATLWLGVLAVAVGAIALVSTLGFYTIDFDVWVYRAGPLLLIALGLFIMGRASHSNVLIAAAGLALALFLVVGAYFSLHDGPTELGVSLSFSPESMLQGGK